MSLEMLAAVWDLELERNEKDVLEVLAWHANADGICWPSKARIMYRTGLSESTVKRTLAALRKKGLITVEKYAEGGRGRTPIYMVHPEKGVKKPPFEEWRKGVQKGASDPKRGSDESEKGVRALTPEPSVENHHTEPSDVPPERDSFAKASESLSGGADALAAGNDDERECVRKAETGESDSSPKAAKKERNWFTFFCELAQALDVVITPEDRTRTARNLKDLARIHSPDETQMHQVIAKMLEARTAGYDLSPQKAYDRVLHRNVYPIGRAREHAEPKRRKKRVI